MKCLDCGCGMSGGFCSNCHEEVFIAEQYSELGEEVPAPIMVKANEQINDPQRIENVRKLRELESQRIRERHYEFFGEYPKS